MGIFLRQYKLEYKVDHRQLVDSACKLPIIRLALGYDCLWAVEGNARL